MNPPQYLVPYLPTNNNNISLFKSTFFLLVLIILNLRAQVLELQGQNDELQGQKDELQGQNDKLFAQAEEIDYGWSYYFQDMMQVLMQFLMQTMITMLGFYIVCSIIFNNFRDGKNTKDGTKKPRSDDDMNEKLRLTREKIEKKEAKALKKQQARARAAKYGKADKKRIADAKANRN